MVGAPQSVEDQWVLNGYWPADGGRAVLESDGTAPDIGAFELGPSDPSPPDPSPAPPANEIGGTSSDDVLGGTEGAA